MSKKIETTLESREVAEMIGKEHKNLSRDINRYLKQLAELNIEPGDFFQKSTYKDINNQTRPCYKITKKGCEFIAHKLIGKKGTEFTARYINRFHEMEDMLAGQQSQERQKPWYIKNFRGEDIILYRDFEKLTGINPGIYAYVKRPKTYRLIGGRDYNAWGWRCDRDIFQTEYGFDYGEGDTMYYLTMSGFIKAIEYVKEEGNQKERQLALKLLPETCVRERKEKKTEGTTIQLNITVNGMPVESTVTF